MSKYLYCLRLQFVADVDNATSPDTMTSASMDSASAASADYVSFFDDFDNSLLLQPDDYEEDPTTRYLKIKAYLHVSPISH